MYDRRQFGIYLAAWRCLCDVIEFNQNGNLVPRVLWVFGQRVGARRDSGVLEFCYRRISAVKPAMEQRGSQSKTNFFFEFSRVSPGAHPLTKKPEDSGNEIAKMAELYSFEPERCEVWETARECVCCVEEPGSENKLEGNLSTEYQHMTKSCSIFYSFIVIFAYIKSFWKKMYSGHLILRRLHLFC